MIQILPLPKPNKKRFGYSNIHPSVPQGSCIFIAPSNSGKTTLMVNLLLRKVFGIIYSYETIHVISPTVFADDSWEMMLPDNYKRFKVRTRDGRKIKSADIKVHDSYSVSIIENIMEEQEQVPKSKRKRVLIILDDIADSIVQSPILDRLFFRGRHSGIFCWISSQLYRRIPRGLRVNSPFYVFFRVNTNELNTISEELAVEDKKTFIRLFMDATGDQYSFLSIDAKKGLKDRYAKNFTPLKNVNKE